LNWKQKKIERHGNLRNNKTDHQLMKKKYCDMSQTRRAFQTFFLQFILINYYYYSYSCFIVIIGIIIVVVFLLIKIQKQPKLTQARTCALVFSLANLLLKKTHKYIDRYKTKHTSYIHDYLGVEWIR